MGKPERVVNLGAKVIWVYKDMKVVFQDGKVADVQQGSFHTVWPSGPAHAHHLMVEAVKANVVPASRLPKVIGAWEEPQHEEFAPQTAWSLLNAFTEVQKGACPRA